MSYLLKNSFDALKPGGIAIHVFDKEEIMATEPRLSDGLWAVPLKQWEQKLAALEIEHKKIHSSTDKRSFFCAHRAKKYFLRENPMAHQEHLRLALEFERAVRFLADRMLISDETSRKPVLFHNIRVGVSLYEKKCARDIVIAGVLHDAIEFAGVSEEELAKEFGNEIARIVRANTKDDTITDKNEKTRELIGRAVAAGENALIVKTADILDSFRWYSRMDNSGELDYCKRNAIAILDMKPDTFRDPIFAELRESFS